MTEAKHWGAIMRSVKVEMTSNKDRRHEQQSNSTAPSESRATRSTWARASHVAAINIWEAR